MKLSEYFDRNCINVNSFARKVGISGTSIYNIVHGISEPNLSIATRIEELTEGKVTCHDLSHHRYRLKGKDEEKVKKHKSKRKVDDDQEEKRLVMKNDIT